MKTNFQPSDLHTVLRAEIESRGFVFFTCYVPYGEKEVEYVYLGDDVDYQLHLVFELLDDTKMFPLRLKEIKGIESIESERRPGHTLETTKFTFVY